MLTVSDLCKSWPGSEGKSEPRRLLDAVSFTAAPGELVALVGESGSGKTTLLNLLAGLDRPDSGHIVLDTEQPVASGSAARSVDVAALDDDAAAALRRSEYGFIFQAFHVLPHLSVADNLALPLWLNRVDDAETARRVSSALGAIGLASRATAWPRELSGGELQRIAVARALIHRPRLVLADEPTGNLDAGNAERVLALLASAVRQGGAIGLLVTHSHAAAAFADRRLVLGRDGTLSPG